VRTLAMLMLALTACAPKSMVRRIETLEGQVASLEAEVERLSEAQGDRPQRPTQRPQLDASAEDAAREDLKRLHELAGERKFDKARALCTEGHKTHTNSRAWSRSAERICSEVEVVGKTAPDLQVETWYQGGPPDGSRPILYVFWEQWCPHCKREVPLLMEHERTFGDRLDIVALTKVNRTATSDKVQAFIQEKGLTFAVGKELNGQMSRAYNVSGVPAAAIVRDGIIVWRGHPAVLNRNNTLREILDAPPPK